MLYNLKRALEQKAGFPLVSVRDFRRLEGILYKENINVSYSTLNRMFNKEKPTHPRSMTLDLLATFLGFRSFEVFCEVHGNRFVQEELFYNKELELKAYLLNNDFESAISLYLDCQQLDWRLFSDLTQVLGQSLFNTPDFDSKVLNKLLNKEVKPPYFLEHFVFEDDFHGHYQRILNDVSYRSEFNSDKATFKQLFMGRKQFLKGAAFELPEPSFSTDNYHLFSRYYELKLLHLHQTGQALDVYIQETTLEILQRHTEHEDLFRDLFNVGRWCRALIYTRSISQLSDHMDWIKLCKRCFHLDYDNIEFKAPIFTFLKLSGDHWLNFDFYKKNRFDNAVIESQLLLSIGLKNKRAIDHFGKALKLNVSF